MARPWGAARSTVIASVASLLLGVHAVRYDDPKQDLPRLSLAQSNSSTEQLTIDDCNALLFTVMSSDDERNKQEVMLVIRGALFEKNGMAVMADFLSDGLYTIEVEQASRTGGTQIAMNKLTVMKTESDGNLFAGAFNISGHSMGWLAKQDGRFFWHSGAASKEHRPLGHHALSGSCFLIMGSAFIAETLTPFNADSFAKDAIAIAKSATVFTGTGHVNTKDEIADLITGGSISLMRAKYASHCGDALRLSLGDVISAVGPPPKHPPPPEPEAAFMSEESSPRTKSMRFTLEGV
jgi:hypothetical protein